MLRNTSDKSVRERSQRLADREESSQRTWPSFPSSNARSSNRSCVGKVVSKVEGVYKLDVSNSCSSRRRYL